MQSEFRAGVKHVGPSTGLPRSGKKARSAGPARACDDSTSASPAQRCLQDSLSHAVGHLSSGPAQASQEHMPPPHTHPSRSLHLMQDRKGAKVNDIGVRLRVCGRSLPALAAMDTLRITSRPKALKPDSSAKCVPLLDPGLRVPQLANLAGEFHVCGLDLAPEMDAQRQERAMEFFKVRSTILGVPELVFGQRIVLPGKLSLRAARSLGLTRTGWLHGFQFMSGSHVHLETTLKDAALMSCLDMVVICPMQQSH